VRRGQNRTRALQPNGDCGTARKLADSSFHGATLNLCPVRAQEESENRTAEAPGEEHADCCQNVDTEAASCERTRIDERSKIQVRLRSPASAYANSSQRLTIASR
jgi:hypothetical protein